MMGRLFKGLLGLSLAITFSIPIADDVGRWRMERFVDKQYESFVHRYGPWEGVWENSELRERIVVKVDSVVRDGIKAVLREDGIVFFFGVDRDRVWERLHRKLLSLYGSPQIYSFVEGSFRVAHPDTIYTRLSRKQKEGMVCNTLTSALASAYALLYNDTTLEVVGMSDGMGGHVVFSVGDTAFSTAPQDRLKEPLDNYWRVGYKRDALGRVK